MELIPYAASMGTCVPVVVVDKGVPPLPCVIADPVGPVSFVREDAIGGEWLDAPVGVWVDRGHPYGASAAFDHPPYPQAWNECEGNFAECPEGSPCSDLDGRERGRCIDLGFCRGWRGDKAVQP